MSDIVPNALVPDVGEKFTVSSNEIVYDAEYNLVSPPGGLHRADDGLCHWRNPFLL